MVSVVVARRTGNRNKICNDAALIHRVEILKPQNSEKEAVTNFR